MAKKPWDDILKGVMQATKKSGSTTAKKTAAKKATASASKPVSRADRSAANKARAAAEREARMKAGSEASAKMRAIRKEKNRAEAIGGDLREMRSEWTRGTQIRKAKEFFADEVGKALDREGATGRVLTKGSQARRTFLEKEVKKFRTMLEREGYPSDLTIGQQRDIARDALERAAKANKAASSRVEQVVGQAKFPKQKPLPKEKGRKGRRGQRNEAEQETITTAARRQYRKELKRGTVGKGDDASRTRSKAAQYAEQTKRQKKSIDQANAGSKPRDPKPVDSKKRSYRERGAERYPEAQRYKDMPEKLRKEMEANAKKGQAGLSKAERDTRLARFKKERESMGKPRGPKPRTTDRYGNPITPRGPKKGK
jgi:hypothetical protein